MGLRLGFRVRDSTVQEDGIFTECPGERRCYLGQEEGRYQVESGKSVPARRNSQGKAWRSIISRGF